MPDGRSSSESAPPALESGEIAALQDVADNVAEIVWRGCGIESGRIEWMRRVAPLQGWETYSKQVPGALPRAGGWLRRWRGNGMRGLGLWGLVSLD
jgi:hypothetical protein